MCKIQEELHFARFIVVDCFMSTFDCPLQFLAIHVFFLLVEFFHADISSDHFLFPLCALFLKLCIRCD